METSISQPESVSTQGCSTPEKELVYRKIAWRLMPFIFCCYLFNYLDRVNIGFAKLQFLHDLKLSDAVYGLGAGLFFIGYVAFEVPSNLLMARIGVRATITRIMVLWGAISVATAFVSTPMQLYLARFFLGVAEAGFFPGIILYLTYWFPAERRGRMTAIFMLALTFAGIVGNPISGWIMAEMGGTWGLRGWQMLFILEGLPAVLLGVAAWFYLADSPARVSWLADHEKAIVNNDLALDRRNCAHDKSSFVHALLDPRVYVAAFAYGTMTVTSVSIALWAPTLIKSTGIDSVKTVGVLMSIPYIAGGLGMYFVGRSSDKRMERRWHTALATFVSGVSLLLLPLAANSVLGTVTLLAICATGLFGAIVVFWTIPSSYLSESARAGGIAFISSLASLCAFFGPAIVGWIKTQTGSLYLGLSGLGAVVIFGAFVLIIGFPRRLLSEHV